MCLFRLNERTLIRSIENRPLQNVWRLEFNTGSCAVMPHYVEYIQTIMPVESFAVLVFEHH